MAVLAMAMFFHPDWRTTHDGWLRWVLLISGAAWLAQIWLWPMEPTSWGMTRGRDPAEGQGRISPMRIGRAANCISASRADRRRRAVETI